MTVSDDVRFELKSAMSVLKCSVHEGTVYFGYVRHDIT